VQQLHNQQRLNLTYKWRKLETPRPRRWVSSANDQGAWAHGQPCAPVAAKSMCSGSPRAFSPVTRAGSTTLDPLAWPGWVMRSSLVSRFCDYETTSICLLARTTSYPRGSANGWQGRHSLRTFASGSALPAALLPGAPLFCLPTARVVVVGMPRGAVALLSHIVCSRRWAALIFQARAVWPSMAFIEANEAFVLLLALLQLRTSYASWAGPAYVIARVIVLCTRVAHTLNSLFRSPFQAWPALLYFSEGLQCRACLGWGWRLRLELLMRTTRFCASCNAWGASCLIHICRTSCWPFVNACQPLTFCFNKMSSSGVLNFCTYALALVPLVIVRALRAALLFQHVCSVFVQASDPPVSRKCDAYICAVVAADSLWIMDSASPVQQVPSILDESVQLWLRFPYDRLMCSGRLLGIPCHYVTHVEAL